MRRLSIALVLTFLLASCGGPRRPFEVGAREFPISTILGRQTDRASVDPPPSSNLEPFGFPGFLQPPLPRLQPGEQPPPPPPSGPCPAAHPFDAAEIPVTNDAPKPPVPATYRYRNSGSFEVVGKSRGEYPQESIHRVHDVQMSSNGQDYQFDVTVLELGAATTTTYRVMNSGAAPGVYLVQVVTPGPRGGDSFRPVPEILLMPFPPPEFGTNLEDETASATQGQYRSSGTDPINRTSMYLEARVNPEGPKNRADACGRWVDAWDITVTDGRIVNPSKLQEISFTGRYAIATQFGALVVKSEITLTGTEGSDQITSGKTSTINSVPKTPQ